MSWGGSGCKVCQNQGPVCATSKIGNMHLAQNSDYNKPQNGLSFSKQWFVPSVALTALLSQPLTRFLSKFWPRTPLFSPRPMGKPVSSSHT